MTTPTWREAVRVYARPRVVAVAFLGFSSGLPLFLVSSTLSFWLAQEGVSLTAIGLFSLVRTPYTFKFLWAPFVDRIELPVFGRLLGRRRSWALLMQLALGLSILGMATTSPGSDPWPTVFFAVLVAFFSASQDIVIDAFRVESLHKREQGAGAGAIVLGYRMGMLASGAGAIALAGTLPWSTVYAIMALCVAVGIVTILVRPEPLPRVSSVPSIATAGEGRLSRALTWLRETFVVPFAEFAGRPYWVAILLFIMLYKLGDAYLGVMANPFYVQTGFTNAEVALVSKFFGVGATIVGGILGGVVVFRFGILRSLLLCGVLQMLSNLVFAVQAVVGHHVGMLVVTIAIENVSGAMATAAFVAYLSSLCNVAYTATQYALLSSFMAFARDVLSASSGLVADRVDWVTFFLITTVAALPGLLLLVWLGDRAGSTAAGSAAKAEP